MRFLIWALLVSSTSLAAAPALDFNGGGNTTFFEGQTTFTVNPNVLVVDSLAGNTMDGAIVLINSNLDSTNDVLAMNANPSGNITAAYFSGNGVLELRGEDTVENYQTALQSVTFTNNLGNLSADKDITMS